MKKLMIAAATAAMIGVGGAWAAPGDLNVYQVNANLKTTAAKDAVHTGTFNLGQDAAGVFWYADPSLAAAIDPATTPATIIDTVNFTLKSVGGTMAPVLTAAGLKNEVLLNALAALAGVYDNKSAGKWCLTFKLTHSVCYRTAGTITVAGYFQDDECLTGFAPDILDCFGAATMAKSTKVELYKADAVAVILALTKKDQITPIDILDNAKGPRVITALAVAGHGSSGLVWDKVRGVTSVSGYAVGTADMPVCVNCCGPAVPVVAWDCCGIGAADTAVFGTFTIKYNAAETKKLY